MTSDCSSHSNSDLSMDMHRSSETGQLQPGVPKDYKDALEALIHMPTMGLKWSNTVAMHNAICHLSDALQGDGEQSPASSSDDRGSSQNETDECRAEERWVPLQLVKQTVEPSKMDYVLTGPYTYPPVAIAPKAYHCQHPKQVNEKEQMRKASHNIIERRRREKINELTQTLATMVPACQQRDGLHPTRSACSKVIILEKTITYLQQVTSENENFKKSASQNHYGNGDPVAMQAMQNQITILEKENEFLRKKLKHILPNSLSLDEIKSTTGKETEVQKTSVSATELAELKALEMIRKLLDSVQKHHGQNGRVQEALKELSAKKLKTLHAKQPDCDMAHIYANNDDESNTVKNDTKRKNDTEIIAGVKRFKGTDHTETIEEVQ